MTWNSTARNLLAWIGVAAAACALLLVGITVGVRAARGIVIRTVNVPAVPAPGPPGGPLGLMMSPKEYAQVTVALCMVLCQCFEEINLGC